MGQAPPRRAGTTRPRRRSSSARAATRARPGWSTPRSTTSPSSAPPARGRSGCRTSGIDSPPSNGDEIQSEYFVDRRQGAAALDAVRRLSPLITPLLLVSEIRATAPDRLWLSGSYERETLAIHFTWRNRPDRSAPR